MIIVTGASGSLGAPLVRALAREGADVHGLSRRPRQGDGVTWHVGDLASGPAVLGEAGTIVHLASEPFKKGADLVQTRTLLEAARPDAHLVYVSIVGIDRHPYAYYRTKLAAERMIEGSGRPYTILRATQFHGFVASFFDALSRGPVLVAPTGTSCQPVAVEEVAARLAELALDSPAGRVPDLGGPEVLDARHMARTYLDITGKRRALLPVRLPGEVGRAFREGLHLASEPGGSRTWTEFLAGRVQSPAPRP
ncbi:SDR family oxidoreductase [Actinocorallia populi]|uniref:SDR family oxidoreductase n=1 Tax=Actinocorallia populi TaxID=2079200 RepID=UPI000D091A81|nr:NAD(P)H-binding protein [Actinocorallia populi]